jgi:hypothetical protein
VSWSAHGNLSGKSVVRRSFLVRHSGATRRRSTFRARHASSLWSKLYRCSDPRASSRRSPRWQGIQSHHCRSFHCCCSKRKDPLKPEQRGLQRVGLGRRISRSPPGIGFELLGIRIVGLRETAYIGGASHGTNPQPLLMIRHLGFGKIR